MLLSRNMLQRILGALWFIDGLFQLQPQMFTMNMVNTIMKPMLEGQPGLIKPSLQFIVTQATLHLTTVNMLIALTEIFLGLAFLFIPARWIKPVVIISILWALLVWYAGEGVGMLLTGQASILTGAPGSVFLYTLLGLLVWPRQQSSEDAQEDGIKTGDMGLLSRKSLRWVLAGFWFFAALLQFQPIWWQPGQLSQAIGGLVGQGGLNTMLLDPVFQQLSNATAAIEIPLNIVLVVAFLVLGIMLLVVKEEHVRYFLIASIVMSVAFWFITEGFGMVLTGLATDTDTGFLLILIALACWPRPAAGFLRMPRIQFGRPLRQPRKASAMQSV
ncbi:MAG: hypothetical protein ACRDHZ_25900 [Ktedonobacteraceae bacterium]